MAFVSRLSRTLASRATRSSAVFLSRRAPARFRLAAVLGITSAASSLAFVVDPQPALCEPIDSAARNNNNNNNNNNNSEEQEQYQPNPNAGSMGAAARADGAALGGEARRGVFDQDKDDDDMDPAVRAWLARMKPVAQQVTFGGVAGFCAGYALREIGKSVAYSLGVGFLLIQGLAYTGYIEVNWNKFEGDVKRHLDVNEDGKVDEEDLYVWWQKLVGVLKFGLTSTVGFTVGLIAGLRA